MKVDILSKDVCFVHNRIFFFCVCTQRILMKQKSKEGKRIFEHETPFSLPIFPLFLSLPSLLSLSLSNEYKQTPHFHHTSPTLLFRILYTIEFTAHMCKLPTTYLRRTENDSLNSNFNSSILVGY